MGTPPGIVNTQVQQDPEHLGGALSGHGGARLIEEVEQIESAVDLESDEQLAGNFKSYLAIMALTASLVLGIYLLGYEIASPLWTLGYFLFIRKWKIYTSAAAALAILVVFIGLSHLITGVIFPTGLI